MEFNWGYYLYVGSAYGKGGIRARVSRHLKKNKKYHWHIDYLLQIGEIIRIFVLCGSEEEEIVNILKNKGFRSIKNFGASDSKHDSHLFVL